MHKSDGRLTGAGWSALFSPLRMLAISACFYFIAAGGLGPPRGWLYYLLVLVLSLGAGFFLFYRSPELLNVRGRMGEDTDSRDKVLLLFLFGTNLVLMPAAAGLDNGRLNLTPLPAGCIYAGAALQLIGSGIVLWAMLENPFFEGTMRLQKERGQHVISQGPYRYLRHPGYLGMAINTLPLPLIAGSRLALLPAILAIAVIVIRTRLEDKLLLELLPGYRDYARKTRHRLLPPLW